MKALSFVGTFARLVWNLACFARAFHYSFWVVCCSFLAPPIAANAAEPPIRIGLLLCQTGNCADWGVAARRGAQLAADKLNSQGGVNGHLIELISEDTAEAVSGAKAVNAFRRLQSKGISLMIGPSWAPGALAIEPLVAKRTDLLLITPSATAPSFSRAGRNLFNVRIPENESLLRVARFAFQEGKRRAAIFASEQPAERALAENFQKEFMGLGGTVVAREEPDPTSTDIRAEALRIVKTFPDVVYVGNYNQMGEGLRALEELGYTGMRVTIALDEAKIRFLGSLLEGAFVAKPTPTQQWFQVLFEQKFNESPGLSAEGGYDAIWALAKAIQRSNSWNDSALIAKNLASIEFEGATGHIAFTQDREIQGTTRLYKVTNGRLQEEPR